MHTDPNPKFLVAYARSFRLLIKSNSQYIWLPVPVSLVGSSSDASTSLRFLADLDVRLAKLSNDHNLEPLVLSMLPYVRVTSSLMS